MTKKISQNTYEIMFITDRGTIKFENVKASTESSAIRQTRTKFNVFRIDRIRRISK